MKSEKKELLLLEEITEAKNLNRDLNFVCMPNHLHPNEDNAININFFQDKNKEVYIEGKTKKPSFFFRKAYLVLDISSDVPGEEVEVSVCYGNFQVYKNIIAIRKTIITRYKTEFKIEQDKFKYENFYIKIRFLPSKNYNENYVFTLFSFFIETIIEENPKEKEAVTTDFLVNNNVVDCTNQKNRKIYIKNFCCEERRNMIKLMTKSRYVICGLIESQELMSKENSKEIEILFKFTLTRLKFTESIKKINFLVDVGITEEKLFKNFVSYDDLEENFVKSFSLVYGDYSKKYTLNLTLKNLTNFYEGENLMLFFSFRGLDEVEGFYLSDIDIELKNQILLRQF